MVGDEKWLRMAAARTGLPDFLEQDPNSLSVLRGPPGPHCRPIRALPPYSRSSSSPQLGSDSFFSKGLKKGGPPGPLSSMQTSYGQAISGFC